jgi:hypothetical protein
MNLPPAGRRPGQHASDDTAPDRAESEGEQPGASVSPDGAPRDTEQPDAKPRGGYEPV